MIAEFSEYEEVVVCGRRQTSKGINTPPPHPPHPPLPRLLVLLPRSKQVVTAANQRAAGELVAFVEERTKSVRVDVFWVHDDECSSQLMDRLLNDGVGNFLETTIDVDASRNLPIVLLFDGSLQVGSWVSRTVAAPPASLIVSAYRVDNEEDLRCLDFHLRRVARPRTLHEPHEPHEPQRNKPLQLQRRGKLTPLPYPVTKQPFNETSPDSILAQVFGDRILPSNSSRERRVASGWERRMSI